MRTWFWPCSQSRLHHLRPSSGRPAQNECADRNALENIAYDARLTAIQFYYHGLIQNLADKSRRICYEAHVLMDDRFVVLNDTRALVEKNCLPIDVAARIAVQGLCPSVPMTRA